MAAVQLDRVAIQWYSDHSTNGHRGHTKGGITQQDLPLGHWLNDVSNLCLQSLHEQASLLCPMYNNPTQQLL